jgi:hypothetical protein
MIGRRLAVTVKMVLAYRFANSIRPRTSALTGISDTPDRRKDGLRMTQELPEQGITQGEGDQA